jgi:phosphohistidine phosphatase
MDELGLEPELVLCSSAARTRETLELLRPALGDASTVRFEDALYAASAETLLERLRAVPADVSSVLLIGHNPGMQDLALLLAASGADLERLAAKFPTAALATLSIATASWQQLSRGDAELTAYVVPKELN